MLKHTLILLSTLALLTACPAENTDTDTATSTGTENNNTQSTTEVTQNDAARGMYAEVMGRYAAVGQCQNAEFYWNFTPTTVQQGETICQIHALDTLADQLSIDARSCVSEGEPNGTRLFYLSRPAPNVVQISGSDLQQDLERCSMS